MNPRLLAGALLIAAALHLFALVNETRAPAAFETAAGSPSDSTFVIAQPISQPTNSLRGRLPTAAPDNLMSAFFASTPSPSLKIASLPRSEVQPTPTVKPTVEITGAPSPTPTAVSDRDGCDPAYPDEETCIPAGPPFDQGCAITAERRFTVLPPDPQSLDHDSDGIGCEPIR